MRSVNSSRYRWHFARDDADLKAAQELRHLAFRGAEGRDVDNFDAISTHVLIEDDITGELLCCFRFLTLENGSEIEKTYSAQHYGLSSLQDFSGPMIELGRFCLAPDVADPNVLRLAWGILTKHVEDTGAELLFGCSSFHGTNPESYADAFAMLKDRHIAPRRWLPRVKAPDVFRFARRLKGAGDRKRALGTMPPLLRSYLTMGGWVSDHAVVDRDLNTLHVFTGLEVRNIPSARVRSLRAIAG